MTARDDRGLPAISLSLRGTVTKPDHLAEFVRAALERGVARSEIRSVLRNAGWSKEEVEAAISGFADIDFPIAVPTPSPSLSAREAFEYVVLFGTLYVSAFALGQLLFQFVDLAFPDPLWSVGRFQAIDDAIRWSISALVVAWPVFLLSARANARRLLRSPVLRGSPVRRWLTYVTLAITASVLIGDGTGLVYNLLGGDLTVPFILKAAIIALIAGTAFMYYISDLRRDEGEVAA